MILKASQRGGGMALAAHLLKTENEHVEVHEVRSFVAYDVKGAMKEAQASALGTRCKQYLFSVSLNPPEQESVGLATFESAVDRIEQANGLTGQPRIIIFHEKEGRRHAHAVWSRIDAETMTARPLPFFKSKLREVSKALYLEHDWQMPRGLIDSREHDPRNFSLAQWQQATRMGRDPKALKATIQECWAASDNAASFGKALEVRGLHLARGDRRAHVVVTYEGEVLSVSRLTGQKAKAVTAKLGKADNLKSVAETRAHIAEEVAPRLEALLKVADAAKAREMAPLEKRRIEMRATHTDERQRMAEGQRLRFEAESKARAARFRGGLSGLLDRFTGKRAATAKQNDREAFHGFQRDRVQRDALVADQLSERRGIQREIVAVRQRHSARTESLHRDLARQNESRERSGTTWDRFNHAAHGLDILTNGTKRRGRLGRDKSRQRGPDLGL